MFSKGRRGTALRQYQSCVESLQRELEPTQIRDSEAVQAILAMEQPERKRKYTKAIRVVEKRVGEVRWAARNWRGSAARWMRCSGAWEAASSSRVKRESARPG